MLKPLSVEERIMSLVAYEKSQLTITYKKKATSQDHIMRLISVLRNTVKKGCVKILQQRPAELHE